MDISKAEEESILGDDAARMTKWKVKKLIVEGRPKGWLKRFAAKVDNCEIVEPPKDYQARREEKIVQSGWKPVLLKLPVPPQRLSSDKIANIPGYQHKRNNLCYLCWSIVPPGIVGVICSKCPVISHQRCLIDMSKYRLPPITAPNVCGDIQRQFQSTSLESGQWVCPFCVYDVQNRNNATERRYQVSRREYLEQYAAIKLQSFGRMVPAKAEYVRAKVGFVAFQRVFRARRFWRKSQIEKNTSLMRPFRVRVHAVYVFIKISDIDTEDLEEMTEGGFHVIGEMMANSYDQLFHADTALMAATAGSALPPLHPPVASATPSTPSPAASPVVDDVPHPRERSQTVFAPPLSSRSSRGGLVGPGAASVAAATAAAAAAAVSNASFASAAESSLKGEADMLALLRAGHIDVPLYQQPFKLSSGRSISRGTFFLTVSVHQNIREDTRHDSNFQEPKQLYRLDCPLKLESAPMKLIPSFLEKLGLDEVSPEDCDYLNSHVRLLKFSVQKPYYLFPGSENNVKLKLTVSHVNSVAEVLKNTVVGISTEEVKNYLIWKRSIAATSRLETKCLWDDLPITDDGSKVDIYVKRPAGVGGAVTGVGGDITSRASTAHATSARPVAAAPKGSSSKAKSGAIGGATDLSLVDPIGAAITWSLLTVSYDQLNHAGETFLLNEPYMSSSRRRQWSVLLDRTLYIFSNPLDVVPKFIIEMKAVHVAPLDDGIIRIKYRMDTWFLFFQRPSDGLEWVRKLYVQSASQELKKYSEAMLLSRPRYNPRAQSPATTQVHKGASWDDYLSEIMAHKEETDSTSLDSNSADADGAVTNRSEKHSARPSTQVDESGRKPKKALSKRGEVMLSVFAQAAMRKNAKKKKP